jgi:hypothetical protein
MFTWLKVALTCLSIIMSFACQPASEEEKLCDPKKEKCDRDPLFSGTEAFADWNSYNGESTDLFEMVLDLDSLEKPETEVLSKEKLQAKMNTFESLYLPAEDYNVAIEEMLLAANSEGEGTELEDCLLEATKTGTTVKARGEEYLIAIDIDTTDCWDATVEEGGVVSKLEDVTYQKNTYVQCLGSDFSSLDGASFADLQANVGKLKCEQQVSRAETSVEVFAFSTTVVGIKQKYTKTKKTALLGENGRSCQRFKSGDKIQYENGCTFYEVDTWDGELGGVLKSKDNEGQYATFSAQDLVKTDDTHKWFGSGAFDITINDWTGKATYLDGTTEPTWTLTNGTDTVTGPESESIY